MRFISSGLAHEIYVGDVRLSRVEFERINDRNGESIIDMRLGSANC